MNTLKAAIISMMVILPVSTINAQMAKEGKIDGKNTYSGTYKVYPLDKDRFVMTYENTGVRVENSGEGLFHNLATHNVGVQFFERGVGKLKGYMTSVDKDGDKVLMEITEENSQPYPKESNGIAIIIGGTGKYSNIQGKLEYTRRNLRSIMDGTMQAVSTSRGEWKIVEPK